MTLVVTANIAGQVRGAPVSMPNRRRRLSTIVAGHRPPAGRRFIVSVHRRARGETGLQPSDTTRRLKAQWSKTLIGPQDVVLITVVPLGSGAASIGLAIASIALIALAPYAAPLIAGAALFGGGAAAGGLTLAIQAGLVIGGVALAYAAQQAKGSKSNKQGELYSISGGGNVPKPGSRRPLIYGKCWSSPPLSQQDYYNIDGDATVLVKRMTLGIGKFQVHRIRVGDALFWDQSSGIQAPFSAATGPLGAAIEFLYETRSNIAPGDIIPSPSVGGQEVPRPGGNPSRTPWYRLAPQGVVADGAQFNWTYPAIYRTSSAGRRAGTSAGIVFYGREIDPVTGNVIGSEFEMWRSGEGPNAVTTTPLRRVAYFRLPKRGAYEVSAQNAYPEASGFEQENRVTWDGMFAFKDDLRIRPQTTEIVLRMRAGKGLTITAYSDITVEATRIVPVWNGNAWVEQATRKAVWAYCDLVRSIYGLNAVSGADAAKALYYANLLSTNDTYDGVLPEVSSFREAASQILHPLRADPVKVGAIHSFVRDESRAEARHVLTRRQIIRDSGGATYKAKVEGSDVIVEFDRDGDPKRPDEVRYSYGPLSRTPKRYKVAGIVDGAHALHHAKWLAAVAVFRGAERAVTTEWDGRLVYPGDRILSDLGFLQRQSVFGVAGAAGNVLTLDCDANVPALDWSYGSIRTRVGKEWGILRMRGQGVRGLELHAGDVNALSSQTGLALADVLARDSQDPTTVVVGDLVELQQSYVARSATPSDADHVRIEMVRDDARVWQILAEPIVGPAPIGTDALAEPLTPQISVLHARCDRIETGIEIVWGVSATRGARNYEADFSYDGGGTWNVLSPFGPVSSGRAQARQADSTVTVRARAYGRTGLFGDWIYATFSTLAPVVAGSLIDISTMPRLGYANLQTEIVARFDDLQQAAAAASQEAKDGLATSLGRLSDFRRSLSPDPKMRAGYLDPVVGDLRRDVAFLSAAVMRNAVQLDLQRDTMAAAGIETVSAEGLVRIAGLSRLETATGTQITNLSVTVDALKGQVELYGSVQTGDLSGLVTAISTASLRLDAQAATIATLATSAQLTDVSARLTSAQQTIDGQNALIDTKASQTVVTAQGTQITQLGTRMSAAEGRIASVVTAAGASVTDNQVIPRLLSGLLDVYGQQIGALSQNMARAETSLSAVVDDAGRAVGEIGARLLVFRGESAASFDTVTRAIADTNSALVQQSTVFAAQVGAVQASLVEEINARTTADTAQVSAATALTARVGTAEAGLTTLQQAVATNASSTATQFQQVGTRFNANEAQIASIVTAYTSADQALSSRIDTVSARAETANAGVATEIQARAAGDAANASNITTLFAQTSAGTAGGRVGFTAVSAPDGVSARYSIQVSTDANGQKNNSGLFIDILSNGQSRVVIDANYFLLTANGGLTYPFQFDGQTLTIPSLRVTQSIMLPGAASDRFAPLVQNIDCGASSTAWREVPGTAVAFTPDDLWSSLFAATVQGVVTAVGSNSNLGTANLQFGIGVDGPPAGPFTSVGQNAGAGGNPNVSTNQGPVTTSGALFEMTGSGQNRRIAVYYKFECTVGGSGKINVAQLKLLNNKR